MKNAIYEFDVMRTGLFNDVTITKSDLQELSEAYNSTTSKAPIVIGHPKDNNPAYGLIDSLKVVGNKLKAMTKNISSDLVTAIKEKKFNEVSLSIYERNAQSNPTKGKLNLRHCGMFGAKRVAVSNLDPLHMSFSELPTIEDGDTFQTSIEFSESTWVDKTTAGIFLKLREFLINKFSIEDANTVVESWEIDNIRESAIRREEKENEELTNPISVFKELDTLTEVTEKTEVIEMTEKQELAKLKLDLAATEAKLATVEGENETLTLSFAEQKQKRFEADNLTFCENAVKENKLAPALKEQMINILNKCSTETMDFGESKSTLANEVKSFIDAQSKILDFTEKSQNPDGYESQEDKDITVEKVQEFSEKHKISFEKAAIKLGVTA